MIMRIDRAIVFYNFDILWQNIFNFYIVSWYWCWFFWNSPKWYCVFCWVILMYFYRSRIGLNNIFPIFWCTITYIITIIYSIRYFSLKIQIQKSKWSKWIITFIISNIIFANFNMSKIVIKHFWHDWL